MADRPTMSMSRVGRPRMRSRSVHVPSHIPVASKARKCRTAQRIPTKGKGAGKGKKATKKSNKAVAVVSSDSEDAPAEEQQEPDHATGSLIEEHSANIPAEDIEQPQNPGYPNPSPVQPPVPMANNQLIGLILDLSFQGLPMKMWKHIY